MTVNGTLAPGEPPELASERHAWVDYAKGLCIIMVVMMHSTLGVEASAGATGFMHAVVEFAKPFRMPDFFLISGLFLARVIDRDWRTYIDRKVVHFAYFYVLWVTIQFGIKMPGLANEHGLNNLAALYLFSFVEPFSTLWFIYLLPIFFVVTKLSQRIPPVAILLVAAGLEMAKIHTGWTVIDEFAARFVYFYAGYLFANFVFGFIRDVQKHMGVALVTLLAWSLINAAATSAGITNWPLLSLALGFAGCAAVIAVAALLAKMRWLDAIRYCGEHTLVIYLAFFLPMATSRILLFKSGLVTDVGLMSIFVTISGIVGALALWWGVRNTALRFLFERPAAFWLTPKPRVHLQAAE